MEGVFVFLVDGCHFFIAVIDWTVRIIGWLSISKMLKQGFFYAFLDPTAFIKLGLRCVLPDLTNSS